LVQNDLLILFVMSSVAGIQLAWSGWLGIIEHMVFGLLLM